MKQKVIKFNGANRNLFLDTETGEWGIWNTLEEAQKNGLGKEVIKKRLCCEKILPKMYTIHMTIRIFRNYAFQL